jgi:hypothetical protein
MMTAIGCLEVMAKRLSVSSKIMEQKIFRCVGSLVTCNDGLGKRGCQEEYIFGDRVPSHDFPSEKGMSSLYWLYLAMAFPRALFCEPGRPPW